MIVALLFTTFVISLVVATIVMLLFRRPIDSILRRLIRDDLSRAWTRYLQFAIYVVGVGGGVSVWSFEKYFGPVAPGEVKAELTGERWVLEIYQAIMGTLQSTAWLLLVFFIFALIALVIVRGLESRRPRPSDDDFAQPIGTA